MDQRHPRGAFSGRQDLEGAPRDLCRVVIGASLDHHTDLDSHAAIVPCGIHGAEIARVGKLALARHQELGGDVGRRPGPRWGPRPIDIDILFHGPGRTAEPDLVVPHERIAERAFVLVPLAEVTDGPLPVIGESAAALLARLDREGIARTEERL